MSEIIKIEHITDHVVEVLINRPENYNTFNTELRLSLAENLRKIDQNKDARIVILRGEGPGFCAGADLNDGGQMPPSKQLLDEYFPIFEIISKSQKLFIASVHGSAAGIGTALAMNCDFTVMAASSRISMVFSNIGLVPDGGATYLLQKSLGYRKALEVIVSGSHLSSEECLNYGLANKIFQDASFIDDVRSWAEELSQRSPLAASAAKQVMREDTFKAYCDRFNHEAREQDNLMLSNDFKAAVESFFKKEKPTFTGT